MEAERLVLGILRRGWQPAYRWLLPRLMKRGYGPTPRQLFIQLTYKCNLRCSFCGQWGDTGTFKNLPTPQLKHMLPLSTLKRAIDGLHPACASVFLWGGEPLQYPDLIPLVRHIKQRGKTCCLVTNGTFLPRYAHSLAESGIDAVDVSLDAQEETHDALRGAPGTFQAAMEGIRLLRAERATRQSDVPRIVISTILLPGAIAELPGLVKEVREAGADCIVLCRLQYTTPAQGKAHEQVFQELFQITPSSWRGFTTRVDPNTAGKIKEVVEALRADSSYRDFVSWWEPTWSPQDLFAYYLDPTTAVPPSRACGFPWDVVCICPNGDVTPCPDFPDVVVGNVEKESLRTIWNGPRLREFRRHLAKRGRFPVCTSCCQLYQ